MTICPTPEKHVFTSKAKAARYQRARYGPRGLPKDRLYPYECPCGEHWHLTHQTPVQQKMIAGRLAQRQHATADEAS